MSTGKFQGAAYPTSHHVYVSFCGKDTHAFIRHLYSALCKAGFRTFRDDEALERETDLKSKLEEAISKSRISIIVISKNYASSTWCLDELVMILQRRSSGHIVLPVFYGVDPSEMTKEPGRVQKLFTWHVEKLRLGTRGPEKERLESRVGKWRTALIEVSDLAGMIAQDDGYGYEAKLIEKIVEVVGDMSSNIAPNRNLVGMHSRVKDIQLWLEDAESNVGIVAICGMGGIGKTTVAEFLYDLNFSRFEGGSFIADVREVSHRSNGLVNLQRQLLINTCNMKVKHLTNVDEGIAMIEDVLSHKKVFVVLDDVDDIDQVYALVGKLGWFFSGSKIIITTRHECLLGNYEFFLNRFKKLSDKEFYKVHRLENLSDEESLELFTWHAFGGSCPDNLYGELLEKVVSYCGGLPLAIKVLAFSLSRHGISQWTSQLKILEEIPCQPILENFRISYDCLNEHDKRLFLNLACFFVGNDKDSIVTILGGCKFYTLVGIQTLIDRCLISIDKSNTLVMHPLLQKMGREVVRQESPTEPGKRSILWNCEDALEVLLENTGTSIIEGLKLDTCLLKDEAYASKVFGDNRKHPDEVSLGKTLPSNLLGRYASTDSVNSHLVALDADAFAKMRNLKLLQLNDVRIRGSYQKFPNRLRWLCWRGFSLVSIPGNFPLESLVDLDMQSSCLRKVWKGTKFLPLLKNLNLSHSHKLIKTPDFSELPNLEKLLLKSCTCLVEVHESIGSLERLVLLNLRNCKKLRNLPRSIIMLENLKMLDISGCSELQGQMKMTTLESPTSLVAGFPTRDKRKISTPDPKPREVEDFECLQWQMDQCSDVTTNMSDHENTSRTSPKGVAILRELYLSHIVISSLPQFISRLIALRKLVLRNCVLVMMKLPPEIGELMNLEVLDLEGTEIFCLPNEIAKLINLTCLKVSFYGYANQTVIPREVLSNLSRLNELIIDVTPYGEWWDDVVKAIIVDLCGLKELRTLKLCLPTAQLLQYLTMLIFPRLASFRFTVGRHEEHFISRLPQDVEEEFNNREKLDKGLKYINGSCIPNVISEVFQHANAFFLQRHWTAKSLSEFSHENLKAVKYCLVMECNEFRTIIDSKQFNEGKDGRSESEDLLDSDEAIVLGSLEKLVIRYMKNMESIWKGPVGQGSLWNLKSLALHTCPNLTTLFTLDMFRNLLNLEELIVEDCPKIDSLVSVQSSASKSGVFLPNLKKISLLELPELVTISSGLCVAPNLEMIVIFYCPKLDKLSTMEVSSAVLKVIKGEKEWWDALKWHESDLSTEHEEYLSRLFIPLRTHGDLMAQLTKD